MTTTTFLLPTSSTVNMNINKVGVYFLWMKIFTLKETFQDVFRKFLFVSMYVLCILIISPQLEKSRLNTWRRCLVDGDIMSRLVGDSRMA